MLTYFSFEKALGSFDSLRGNVDFRETSERAQTAVLGQLSCSCLPEDQQELTEEDHQSQVRQHFLSDAGVPIQTGLMEPAAAHLSEAEPGVQVLIHLFHHVLQAQMGLRCSQLLHHLLQLHHIDVVVLFQVVPSNSQVLPVSLQVSFLLQ